MIDAVLYSIIFYFNFFLRLGTECRKGSRLGLVNLVFIQEMETKDRADDQTFKVDFSSTGAAKLRERVTDKLKEFMGDYTDDTLVEYVIVLLRNGRSKREAKTELDVFLGDDSDSFVTWLWDHLASDIDQYIHARDSSLDKGEKDKCKSVLGDRGGKTVFNHVGSDSDQGKFSEISRSRHSRGWKGLAKDAAGAPLLSSDIDDVQKEGKKAQHDGGRTKQSISPQHPVQRKRGRSNDQDRPRATIGASRRLLQFAVRDAIATTKPSIYSSEPSLKRIRSEVSAATDDAPEDVRPRRMQSVARVPNSMETAIRAVAEAAEDVRKVKPVGSVFDRLSRGEDALQRTSEAPKFREPVMEDEFESYNQIYTNAPQVNFQRSDLHERLTRKSSIIESNTEQASDYASDDEGYNDVNVMRHEILDLTQSGGNREDEPMMMHYSIAQGADAVRQEHMRDLGQPVTVANSSHKTFNRLSPKVNMCELPHYQLAREVAETEKFVTEIEVGAAKSNVPPVKENNKPLKVNGNVEHDGHMENEVQNSVGSTLELYSTSHPVEDADSRTIFLGNVHFAATRDSLSRHFNKFGEVSRVTILTDPATGQPKGSAYVEFMRKEAAENALTLNGTSFMSRLLKVVKKSSAQQEANPTMTWPRVARGSPFAVSRFGRAPFPRIIPGTYRGRPTVKSGARSMQWKRDAQPSSSESGAAASSNSHMVPFQPGRGFTYVRTEAKVDGKS